MNTADSNVTDMNIPHITECFSSFSEGSSKIVFVFRTVIPNDKLQWPCSSLRGNNGFSVPSWFSSSSSSKMTCLIGTRVSLSKSKQRVSPFYHPSIHQLSTLRRPSFVIVPSWAANWVRAFNKLLAVVPWRVTCVTANNGCPRFIIFLSFRTPGTLTS